MLTVGIKRLRGSGNVGVKPEPSATCKRAKSPQAVKLNAAVNVSSV
jgi:hypothetical protein